MESDHRIDSALELGCCNHLQVVARLQRHDLFVDDELTDSDKIIFRGLHQVIAFRMIVGDLLKHLAEDRILALLLAQACVIVVVGVVLLVQRQRQFEHLSPRLSELALGVLQHLVRRDVRLHHQAKFLGIKILAEPPGSIRFLFREIILQPLRENLSAP